MFAQQQQFPQPSQPALQFPTNYHIQQQQQQRQQLQQAQQSMAMAMPYSTHHQNPNNTATPNNSYAAGTIDPGLLMTMNHMNPLFSSSSASSITSLGSSNHPMAIGRGLGAKRNSSSNTVKQETGSPDFLASEMEISEPTSMLSPGSTSPLNSPRNDFDSPDDFGGSNGGSTVAKPMPVNIQHQNSYGESPGNGSLYSPVEDTFPEDFSLPTRPLDMKFGRPMHPGSLPNNPYSMSMPVGRSDWFGSVDAHAVGSFENPSGLQFGQGEMTGMMGSLYEEEDQRALVINEKRRRRRESHNAVERRRRDNINEKIQELSTLLPDIYVDSANKPNKGVILRKSVDYIRHLQQLVSSQATRNQELEAQLQAKNSQSGSSPSNNGTGTGTGSNGGTDDAKANGSGPGPQLQQDFNMLRIVSGGGNGGQN